MITSWAASWINISGNTPGPFIGPSGPTEPNRKMVFTFQKQLMDNSKNWRLLCNPNGIEQQNPGLRGTSYLGKVGRFRPTPTGLRNIVPTVLLFLLLSTTFAASSPRPSIDLSGQWEFKT